MVITMAKIKIGVFGAGRGGDAIRQLFDDKEAEIVAICDKVQSLLDRVKKDAEASGLYNIAYYTDFEEFFRHDMDGVIIANYANEHVPYAIRFLDSGRHVMTECLTCATMKEAVELIEAVERNGKIYSYAENYCYTPVRWEMRKRYLRGDIGELMYGECEYIHDCSGIWPMITYGQKNHWRNQMSSTFYCTHSIGPMMKMTGLRPVQVTGMETRSVDFMRRNGFGGGSAGILMLTMNNGAVVKSVQGNLKHVYDEVPMFQLNGEEGAMKDMGDGNLFAYIEGNKGNGRGTYETYAPAPIIPEAAKTLHEGSDYYTTYYFVRSILGDENAVDASINVYDAVDMCTPGILGYRSIVGGNVPFKVPNLRNKEERDAYRNDTFCTFPHIAGNQYVSSNYFNPDPIADEVYDEVKRKWIAGERG